MKRGLDEHAKYHGITFSKACNRELILGDRMKREYESLSKHVKGLNNSNGVVQVNSVQEGERILRFMKIKEMLSTKIMHGHDVSVGISLQIETYRKFSKEAKKNGRTILQELLFGITFGLLVRHWHSTAKREISNAVIEKKMNKGNFMYYTELQNVVNWLEEIFADIEGENIEEFEKVKNGFLEDLDKMMIQENESVNGLVLEGHSQTRKTTRKGALH